MPLYSVEVDTFESIASKRRQEEKKMLLNRVSMQENLIAKQTGDESERLLTTTQESDKEYQYFLDGRDSMQSQWYINSLKHNLKLKRSQSKVAEKRLSTMQQSVTQESSESILSRVHKQQTT